METQAKKWIEEDLENGDWRRQDKDAGLEYESKNFEKGRGERVLTFGAL